MNAKLAGALLFGLVVTTSSYLGQTIPLEATAIGQEENVDARSQAEELLRRARTAMKGGNLQLADRLVTQAEKMNVDFSGFLSRFSDSPGKARRELTRLQQASSKASKPDRLPADAVDSANQLKRPIDPNAKPASPEVQAQARRLMAQAKAAFDRGELDKAEVLSRQAQAYNVPEKAFAGGDTPWELGLKINKQRQLAGITPASANGQSPKVARAIYDPSNDETYVRTVAAEESVGPANNLIAQQFPGVAPVEAQPGFPALPGTISPQNVSVLQSEIPASAGPSDPAPANYEPEPGVNNQALELIQLGEQAIQNNQLTEARGYFVQAWAMRDQLAPNARQHLQDHLQLLRTDADNTTTANVSIEDRAERDRINRYISDVQREQIAIAQDVRNNPKDAWEAMKRLRENVHGTDLPQDVRQALSNRLDQAVREMEAFIDANRAQIELDERNREVLATVDRERKMRVELENKLASMVEDFNQMMDQQRFSEAYVLAKQARELAPNHVVTESLIWKSRFAERMFVEMNLQERGSRMFEKAMDAVDPSVPIGYDDQHPLNFPKKWDELIRRREGLLAGDRSRYNEAEQAIERALLTQVQVQFNETPLAQAIDDLAQMAGINVFLDTEGLAAEGVTSDTPVTMNLSQKISLRSVLNLILGQHRLAYIIQDEVLRITSEQARAGDTYTRPYYVGDLVIPIPNFLPGYNNGMAGALAQAHAALGYGPGGWANNRSQQAPLVIAENENRNVGSPLALGQLSSANPVPQSSPQSSGMGSLGGATGADFDTLINLITSTVAPESWDDVGGPGAIESFEGNLSLVISNTQEVHEEIVDLLEQLRRLQDLQVTIEVRFVTLQDNFFERIGVDFDFDINDDSGLAQADLVDDAFDEDGSDITIGLDPNGNPTLDLDLSFSQNSFGSAVPAFGGFDPGAASTFGFAILSDIEAFFVVEAIQGDTRTNVMQAPKITMFNGQFATINDTSSRPFVTSVIPVVGDFAVAQQPVILVLAEGTQLSVQAVVSNDRRFVRLTMLPMFSQIGDVDTFTFEGSTQSDTGSSSETDADDNTTTTNNDVQFTQGTTVQLPNFATTSVSTTVSVPDGGTVLMGGIKRLAEGRNERGMPILSKLPYVSRLFKNVGIGRETQTLMMMVTPRIIIQEEEEERVLGTSIP